MKAVVTKSVGDLVSYNPATGAEVGRVPIHSAEDVQAAVERSREVFHMWKTTSFAERKRLVMRAREVILADIDGIAKLISAESGKPFGEAIAMEIAPVLDLMQWVARGAEKMLRSRRVDIGLYRLLGRSSKIVYHPLGVVGIIPAWNYPFSIPLGEAAMALMAGNTVVIKPSELTPLIGLKIGEIFDKAGAPAGLVQVVTGAGETGAALVDAAPDKVMFTGSVATGKKIAAAAAKNLTSVVLELGGKDPMIVFDDANLELAAGAAVWGAFCNAGQSCSSVERLYVQEGAAEELTRLIVEKTRALRVGPGDSEDVSVGAMSSERQLRIVEDHVADFLAAGARVETGGRVFDPTDVEPGRRVFDPSGVTTPSAAEKAQPHPPLLRQGGEKSSPLSSLSKEGWQSDAFGPADGVVSTVASTKGDGNSDAQPGAAVNLKTKLFYEPTVITGATNDMRGMREETFGPTLPIATFKTEEEAVRLANDSEFGLTASVWTGDYAKGRRVAERIEAGTVCINEVLYTHGIGQTPWGGFKNSGRGRTHGLEGLMELVQPQHIHTNRVALLPDAWWMPYSSTAVETFRGFATKFASGSLAKTTALMPQLQKRIRELLKVRNVGD